MLIYLSYTNNCKKYWWTNILYVNNYVEVGNNVSNIAITVFPFTISLNLLARLALAYLTDDVLSTMSKRIPFPGNFAWVCYLWASKLATDNCKLHNT